MMWMTPSICQKWNTVRMFLKARLLCTKFTGPFTSLLCTFIIFSRWLLESFIRRPIAKRKQIKNWLKQKLRIIFKFINCLLFIIVVIFYFYFIILFYVFRFFLCFPNFIAWIWNEQIFFVGEWKWFSVRLKA